VKLLTDACRPRVPRISINCFAIYSGGRMALIETGSGNSMGPTLGFMPRNLAVPRGVEPPTFGLGNRFSHQFINDLRPNVANVLHPFRHH